MRNRTLSRLGSSAAGPGDAHPSSIHPATAYAMTRITAPFRAAGKRRRAGAVAPGRAAILLLAILDNRFVVPHLDVALEVGGAGVALEALHHVQDDAHLLEDLVGLLLTAAVLHHGGGDAELHPRADGVDERRP